MTRGTMLFLFLSMLSIPSRVFAQLPDTDEFMGMLTACASGATTKFDANLIGSIKQLYDGQGADGHASLETQSDFLKLLPDKDKLEGYRLYTECIKSIVADPSGNKAELQRNFLNTFDFSTTLDKVKEVFGAPSKSKDGYLRFDGVELSFFAHISSGKEIDRVAVYEGERRFEARIPMLNMGNEVKGKQLFFYNLGDFKFSYMPDLCQTDTISEGHARFLFKMTEPCYFGRPGGYMSYVFVFQPDFDGDKCNDDFISWTKYVEYKCKTTLDLIPVMALVYSEKDGYNAQDDANSLMEWIYNF